MSKKLKNKKLTRRDFFKLSGTAAVGAAVSLIPKKVLAHVEHEKHRRNEGVSLG